MAKPVAYYTVSVHADRLVDAFGDYNLPELTDKEKTALLAGLSLLQWFRLEDGGCEIADALAELIELEEDATEALEEVCEILDGIPTHEIRCLQQFLLQ